jgi:serine O-acetyltransferase
MSAERDIPGLDWCEPDPDLPVPFWASLAADVRAHVDPPRRPRSWWGWTRTGLGVAVCSPGLRAVFLYRLAHSLRWRLGLLGRFLAALLFWFGRHWYGCSLAATARLYGGLMLPHPQGIVVGAGVVVGPRAWVFQNVTLGGAPGKEGLPHVGADSRLFCGAVIAGPVTLGDNVMVGANAVIARDVPSRMVVRPPRVEIEPLPGRFQSAQEDDYEPRPGVVGLARR